VSARPHALAALVAVLAAAADQLSKALVRGAVEPGERIELVAGVDLVRVGNDGIAFGLLDGMGWWVTVLAALAFVALMGYFLAHAQRPLLWLPLGLLAGGAIGNLIDRARDGFVTDFIDPPRWPAFNLADVEITIGVVMLFVLLLREPDRSGDPAGEREPA
jgi:signal peptidase II